MTPTTPNAIPIRRLVTGAVLLLTGGLTALDRLGNGWLQTASPLARGLNALFLLCLCFLLLGSPLWLLLGEAAQARLAAERRAFRIDALFVLAAFLLVWAMALAFRS